MVSCPLAELMAGKGKKSRSSRSEVLVKAWPMNRPRYIMPPCLLTSSGAVFSQVVANALVVGV